MHKHNVMKVSEWVDHISKTYKPDEEIALQFYSERDVLKSDSFTFEDVKDKMSQMTIYKLMDGFKEEGKKDA